jgi:hypothetical protein
MFERLSSDHRRVLRKEFAKDLSLVKEILNLEYKIASHYMWVFRVRLPVIAPVLLSCFHKNLFAVYSSIDLTQRGFYGAARPNIRQAYEALVIAKYCSIRGDRSIFERWEKGQPIYLASQIFRKVKEPNVAELRDFWTQLCGFTHASIYAQQIDLSKRDDPGFVQTGSNLVFLKIVLECNYHILSRHLLTESVKYFARRYGGVELPAGLRRKIKNLLTDSKVGMLPKGKRVISTFRRRWVFNP